ncbi:MAG: cytochrome c oxidase subunit 3 family protein [Planctomycetes bacterium]|nr:cytochrome c oxidase subunit 3 family protein [Planctomycetota bacterium]
MSSAADHHAEVDPAYRLAHHFESPEQQFETGKFGMWAFLVTEILFFSGLFTAYSVYRSNEADLFSYASGYLDTTLGCINTAVLILSSLTMAWAVRCAQLGQQRGLKFCLIVTLLCAGGFMGIKSVEYHHKIHNGLFPNAHFGAHEDPDGVPLHITDESGATVANPAARPAPENLRSFFGIYFCMTGLHGLHVLIGMGVIFWLYLRARRGEFGPKYFGPIDFTALYWHVVDLIWIFLFPLLYLIH